MSLYLRGLEKICISLAHFYIMLSAYDVSDIWIFYSARNKKQNGPVTGHKSGTFAQLVRMLIPTEL